MAKGIAIPDVVETLLFAEDAERDLHAAVEQAIADTDDALKTRDYVAVLGRLARLRPAVDTFFEKVMVNADDPAVRCLVLTTFLNERLVVAAIRSGAKGYVLKDVDADALVRSIRAVQAGESAFDSHAAAVVVRTMAGDRTPDTAVVFTTRESEVVRLLAHGQSNRQIGHSLFISETTVKFHVHNVMRKLGVTRRAEVVYRSGQLGLLPMTPG